MNEYTMREPRNCVVCGRVFTYEGTSDMCPLCRTQDEIVFKRIKEYLWEYPGSSITAVSAALGISTAKIRRYIKEDRIEITGIRHGQSYCKKCLALIPTGDYCERCYKEAGSLSRNNLGGVGYKANKNNGHTKGSNIRFK